MAAHLETRLSGGCFKQVLDIATHEIGRHTAHGAQQVMMVALMAQLVAYLAIFEENAAHEIGADEKAQATINGGATNAGQRGAEVFGGERPTLGGDRTNDQTAGFSVPVAQVG